MGHELLLSHWGDGESVVIPERHTVALTNYHLIAVRFLYSQFRKRLKGVILSEDRGMNFELQVSTFLYAVGNTDHKAKLILVIAAPKRLRFWHYYLTEYSGIRCVRFKDLATYFTDEDEACTTSKENLVLLVTHEEATKMERFRNIQFFMAVLDCLDQVVTSKSVNCFKADFRIGLTHWNYLKCHDLKLLWKMLRWADYPVGKFDGFCMKHNEYLNNLVEPYQDTWLRLTWKFCNNFSKPDDKPEFAIPLEDSEESDYELPTKKRKQPSNKRDTSVVAKKSRHNKQQIVFEQRLRTQKSPKSTPLDSKQTEGSLAKLDPTKNVLSVSGEELLHVKSPKTCGNIQEMCGNIRFRKYNSVLLVSTPPANLLDDLVLEEFSKEFQDDQKSSTTKATIESCTTSSQKIKFRKFKSDSHLLTTAARLIDRHVLEEFQRDFESTGNFLKTGTSKPEILNEVEQHFANKNVTGISNDYTVTENTFGLEQLDVTVGASNNNDTTGNLVEQERLKVPVAVESPIAGPGIADDDIQSTDLTESDDTDGEDSVLLKIISRERRRSYSPTHFLKEGILSSLFEECDDLPDPVLPVSQKITHSSPLHDDFGLQRENIKNVKSQILFSLFGESGLDEI